MIFSLKGAPVFLFGRESVFILRHDSHSLSYMGRILLAASLIVLVIHQRHSIC